MRALRRLTLPTLAAAAMTVLFLSAPAAQAETYAVDVTHSEVGFQIRHLVTSVRGRFDAFEGAVNLDKENPANSSVEFKIDAASINTYNERRDNHLRSADFFHVEEHPEITFKSSKFEKTGENTYDVSGKLTMHGVTKDVTLPVTFLGEMVDPWGNTKAGFETEITLDRKDYGITWNKTLDQGGVMLGDDVKVQIDLQTVKEKAEGEGEAEAAE